IERKSIRKSTAVKSAATAQRLKERCAQLGKRRNRLKRHLAADSWKPTQEELLAEAKITEQENIKSLEKYQKMELEKKKCRVVKKVFTGPIIRYYSLSMPIIEDVTVDVESKDVSNVEVVKAEDVEGSGCWDTAQSMDVSECSAPEASTVKDEVEVSTSVVEVSDIKMETDVNTCSGGIAPTEARCERTFITFSDENTFRQVFPVRKPPEVPVPKICPFTRQVAKYFDPVTECAYSNVHTFKILREAYYTQMEAKAARATAATPAASSGNGGGLEVVDEAQLAQWLAWRQRVKEARQLQTRIRIDATTLQHQLPHLKT
ncbi:hypothetical protein AAG570_001179, partial [Ranatra chinensis]